MSKSILALDVGAGGVKLAEFTPRKDGSLELLRYATASIGTDPASEESRSAFLVSAIGELLAETGIKPGPVFLSVSGQSVFSRYVKLPVVDTEKIYSMVRYEAQQNVPFPIEEVEWDYQILNRTADEIEALLVAIKKEILSEIIDAVTSAGMEVNVVDVAPMAVFNTVRRNYPEQTGCTLVLDMGSRSTNLIFMDEERVFSRSIPVAGNTITQQIMKEFDLDFDQAEQLKLENAVVSLGGAYEPLEDEVQEKVSKCVRSVMTRMHMEITRSINFYRGQQSGNAPEQILLTGGTSIIPHADTFLAEKLELPVEYLNPFQVVSVSEQIPNEQIEADAHKLSEVVGLALRKAGRCPIELNLMPKDVLRERENQRRQPLIFAGIACILAAVAAWAIYFSVMAGRVEKDVDNVRTELAGLQGLSGRIKSKMTETDAARARLDALQAIVTTRPQWNQLLDAIRASMPEGAWITSLEVTPITTSGRSGEPSPGADSEDQRRQMLMGSMGEAEPEEEKKTDDLAIQVKGLFYEDVFKPSLLTDYVEALRTSPFISKKTAIIQRTTPKPGDFTRGFWIQVVPKKALQK